MAVPETVESLDDEPYDRESFDDEPGDSEAEFLGTLLGGPAAAIGNVIGGLFRPPTPPRPPLPRVSVPAPGPGVSSATLNTPQGSATLRLPEPVVTRQEFDAGIRRNISNFALANENDLTDGLTRLRADLDSGVWDGRYGHLRLLPELDLGHRLLIAELDS